MSFTSKETLKDLVHKARLFTSALVVAMEENMNELKKEEGEDADEFSDRLDYMGYALSDTRQAYKALKGTYKYIHTELK